MVKSIFKRENTFNYCSSGELSVTSSCYRLYKITLCSCRVGVSMDSENRSFIVLFSPKIGLPEWSRID